MTEAREDIGPYLMGNYNWKHPHTTNVGLALEIAEEKLILLSGIS